MMMLHDDHRPAPRAERALFTDNRLEAVFGSLAGPEAEATLRWAVDGWDQVAVGANSLEAYGKRVRRKPKRLGARQGARAVAAEASQASPATWEAGR